MNLKDLEKGILITDFAAAGDGGSLSFMCETTKNEKFNLLFTQFAFLDDPDPKMLPGRIYLDQNLIDLKSENEKLILTAILSFSTIINLKELDPFIDNRLTEIFESIVLFFDSNASVDIKNKVEDSIRNQSI